MLICAIDPGANGGLAAITRDGEVLHTSVLPIHRDKTLRWINGRKLLMTLSPYTPPESVCVVERVGPHPEQGLSSTWKFGVCFGSILSIVQTLPCKLVLVTPLQWKRALGLLHTDKSASLVRARQLYPRAYLPTPRHTDQAEALLIAHWYREFKLKEAT